MPQSRRLLVAASLLDLQSALARSLAEAWRLEPLAALPVIVPTARLAAHLEGVVAAAVPGPVRLRPLTWAELAILVTARQRWEAKRRFVGREAAAFLAQRGLARQTRPTGYFSVALERRGFRSAMLRCFDELAAAGLVRPRDVERFLVRNGAELGSRSRHVLELVLGYRRAFGASVDDEASVLAQAAALPPGQLAAHLGTARLAIYGFERLTVLEQGLLQSLVQDPGLSLDVFCLGADAPAFQDWLPTLGFERQSIPSAAAPEPEIQVLSTPGDEAEAQEIARRVLQAAADGVPYERIAVATRAAAALPLLYEALTEAAIPCLAPTLFSMASRRAGRALLLFLDLCDGDFTPTNVLDFLLLVPARWEAWCGIDADPVPSAWERVARQVHLGAGLLDWRRKLQRHAAAQQVLALERDGAARRATAAAAAAVELLRVAETLASDLRRLPARATWSEFVTATVDFITNVFTADAESEALCGAVTRLGGLDCLPGPRPTRSEFRDALRHLLADARVAAPESRADGVHLGTVEELQGCHYDCLCLAGLQEGEWPGPSTEDPVLPDRERATLNGALGHGAGLRLRGDLVARQRRLFRVAVGSARQRLVLAFARLDAATAAARLPSSLLLELAEEREGRSLDYQSFAALPWCERVPLRRREAPRTGPILSQEEFDAIAVASLGAPAARRYVRSMGPGPARGLALEALRNGRRRFTVFDGFLAGSEARAGLVRTLAARPFSASQLATYATCPFRYFLRHLLRLEALDHDERKEPTVLEVGRLVHRILENFYGQLAEAQIDVASAAMEVLRPRLLAAAESCFDAVEEQGQHGARLLWEIRKQHLRDDLLRFLRHEIQRARSDAGWVPAQFEVEFGPEAGWSPAVARRDGVLRFRGSIDRIDSHPHHDGVCVVDYKSGRMTVRRRYPPAVQLVLYLLAACRGDDERLALSEARFVHVTRRGGFQVQHLSGPRLVARRADFEALVLGIAAGIEAGEFFPQPGDNGEHCKFCDYRGLCDARIGHQVERKSAGGQDARWRALPDFGADLEVQSALDEASRLEGDDD